MKVNDKLELENIQRYHYVLIGFSNIKKVLKKMKTLFKFYRIEYQGKVNGKEIIYDVPNSLLSDSGIVISKQYEDKKIMFKVRKISQLPGEMKRPSKKFLLGELEEDAEPRDYSLQISSAIENSFATAFTVDLDSFVKQTVPKIQIDVKSQKYQIIGGSGYRAVILYETATYKDIKTGKKVSRDGVTLRLNSDEQSQKENTKIINIIDREIKELALYNLSRFEIAQKLLYPKTLQLDDEDRFIDEEE